MDLSLSFFWMATICCLALGVGEVKRRMRSNKMRRRIGRVHLAPSTTGPEEESVPFTGRVVLPLWRSLVRRMGPRVVTDRARQGLSRRLARAGIEMGPEAFVLRRMAIAACAGAGVFILLDAVHRGSLWLGPMVAMFAYLWEGVHLTTREHTRIAQVDRALPGAFDFLCVTMEAGMAFDAGLQRVSERMEGPIGEELRRVLSDIRIGYSRLEAVRNLAERTGLADLERFAALLAQSERTGTGMVAALKIQSEQIKTLRVQRAREHAAMLPVKMIFPMVLFIMPALFVVILGPGMMSIMGIFKGTGS